MTATTPRLGYLGPAGTFTEQALRSQADLVGDELLPMPTIIDVLLATDAGEIDRGFVAIENAIEGTVNVTLDALAFDTDLVIQREVVMDIHLNLMAAPGTRLVDVKRVASHPVANAQVRGWVRANLPDAEVVAANSTADAAREAAEHHGTAAVGPMIAGANYGLDALATDIGDHPGNKTRFVLVARDGVPPPSGNDKTTVVIAQREDKPGSLVAILQEFAARSINLSKLNSRPAKTSFGDYCFIVDLDGHIGDDVVANCLMSIHAKFADIKFLGSYPADGGESRSVREEMLDAQASAAEWMAGLRARIV